MSRNVKKLMIDSIQHAISGKRDLLVVDVSKVSAVSVNKIRLDLSDRGITLLCVKNAVASRALADLGINSASEALVGPSALVFGSEDIVAISKVIMKCADDDKSFTIRSGIVEGRVLSSTDVEVLSKSPGKPELLSQLVSLILSPGARLSASILSYGSVIGQIESLSSSRTATD